jgi:hypothetical protein
MRDILAYAAAAVLLSVTCAEAQTPVQNNNNEAVTGVNVQAPPKAPIPPTPALAPIHRDVVAGTVDSLPAAQREKMRESNIIEEQDRVAAASPEITPRPASLPLTHKAKQVPSRPARAASKAPQQKTTQPGFRGM